MTKRASSQWQLGQKGNSNEWSNAGEEEGSSRAPKSLQEEESGFVNFILDERSKG
jgi:hypothetical protein